MWMMGWAQEAQDDYTNEWIAKIHGGKEIAQRVARELGFLYKGQVRNLILQFGRKLPVFSMVFLYNEHLYKNIICSN